MGKIAALVNAISSVRRNQAETALVQQQVQQRNAGLAYAKENPDWAEQPEGIEAMSGISPDMAAQGAVWGPQNYNQRIARKATILAYHAQFDRDSNQIYEDTLRKNSLPLPQGTAAPGDQEAEGDFGVGAGELSQLPNFTAARKAANDYYQRGIQMIQNNVSPEVANQIRSSAPVWTPEGYEERAPIFQHLANFYSQQAQIVMRDPDTGMAHTVTMKGMPNQINEFLDAHKGALLLKMGEGIPETFSQPNGPLGPQISSRGEVKPGPLAEQSAQERQFFAQRLPVQTYLRAEPVYLRGKQAIRMGDKSGDEQAIVARALLDNPDAVATEGGVHVIASPGLLSADVQQWINLAQYQGGVLFPAQRREFDRDFDITMSDYRHQFMGQFRDAQDRERLLKLPAGTITGAAPFLSDEKFAAVQKMPWRPGGQSAAEYTGPGTGVRTGPAADGPLTAQDIDDPQRVPDQTLLEINAANLDAQGRAALHRRLEALGR